LHVTPLKRGGFEVSIAEQSDDGYVNALSRLTSLAFDDLGAAQAPLRALCEQAHRARRPERAAVLAALAVQWAVSDFSTLSGLRPWSADLAAAAPDGAALETHAALVWCAGVIAAHQFIGAFDAAVRDTLPSIDHCLAQYRARLLGADASQLDPNLVVATAEHPASWWSNTGDRGAIDEVSVVIDRLLGDPRLSPRVRARWLFWFGAIQMQNDQRPSAEAAWARARAAQAAPWPWLEFHLNRVAARPLLDDGRLDAAREHITALKSVVDPARPLDLGDYHHLQGWLALLNDEPRLAAQHYRLALDAAQRAALPAHMAAVYDAGLAQSLLAMGEEDECVAVYQRLHFTPGPKGEAQRATGIGLARAVQARRTQASDYAQHLAQGLAAARDLGLLRFLRTLPRLAAALCADALELDIEADFVRKVIAARGLVPPPHAGESWPWPLKLHGLRPFAVIVDGEVLRFDGKAPAKPLQLLRLLVAHGGMPLPVGGVADRLWPDLDAPEARRSLDVTLNRLRALLVHRDVLTLTDGQLALDAGRVWIDVRALDAALRDCGEREHTQDAERRKRSFERLARLYRTPLLQGDDDPWIVGARDALRRRFLLGVESLAREAEREGQHAEVAWMRQWAASLAAD
jgi:LuxR family transcriptional regulator, maltose regulon positive regulatory protein